MGGVSMEKEEIPMIIKVQMYLSEKFDFRYNDVLGRTEFRFKQENGSTFRKMTDYYLNSIHLELKETKSDIGIDGLRNLLKSRYVPRYNPFHDYLNNLPLWDSETDYIGMLAATVNTTDNQFFEFAFRKWIVAMTGSLLKDEVIKLL